MNSTIRRCLNLNVIDCILLHRLIINTSLKMSMKRFGNYQEIHIKYNNRKIVYAVTKDVISCADIVNPFCNHPSGMLSRYSDVVRCDIQFKIDNNSIHIMIHQEQAQLDRTILLEKIRDDYYRGTIRDQGEDYCRAKLHIFNIEGDIINIILYYGIDGYYIKFMNQCIIYTHDMESSNDITDNMRRAINMIQQ